MAGTGLGEPIGVLFEHLEKMLNARTVFGEPITIGEVVLIPVVDICFGAGAGGGTAPEKSTCGSGGGGGAGARMTASAIIAVRGSHVQVMKLKQAAALDRVFELIPELLQSLKKDKAAEAGDGASEQE